MTQSNTRSTAMKRTLLGMLVVAAVFALAHPTAAAAPEAAGVPGEGPAGDWLGALDVGPTKLRLALHVEAAADGTLTAVLHSVDQGARIPVDTLEIEERAWRRTAGSIGATSTGTMNADGSAVEGTFTQGDRSFPLRLVRLAEPFALAAGNEDFEVRVLTGLNHLFQHAESGAVDEYGAIEETFSPQALNLVTDWIGARFGGAATRRAERDARPVASP